ncbi:Le.MFB1 [Lentinula aciculospora]|uniref:Le.MFB1 n=1 Tax=Lentinula aciculospora TaxID=153920 RepID=A0A9W9DEM5_9AGAR|nr:Le.MFB1 [Lentinula aciculospora]
MNVDGENIRRSSTTPIHTHRMSPAPTPNRSALASLTSEPAGSGSDKSTSNGLHIRGGATGGGARRNGVGTSHANGVAYSRKGGRSISPVASSSLASTSSASTSNPQKPSQSPIVSTIPSSLSTIPMKRKHPSTLDGRNTSEDDPESIHCICGFNIDDGWSVGCDGCGRWVHGVCFGFEAKDKENLPDHWWCWECDPSLLGRIDRDKARSLQIARMTAIGGIAGNARRKTSPGIERKARKISIATGAGTSPMLPGLSTNQPSNFSEHGSHKRKRTSVAVSSPLTSFPFPLHNAGHSSSADDFIDVDESWSQSYIDISQDIIPHSEVRDRLRKQASEWRGVSAISPIQHPSSKPGWPYFNTTPVRYSHQISRSNPPVSIRSLNSNPEFVLPPSYAVHTTHPIPSHSLLAPYPSVITSSSSYLQDPLNSYAALGMPKPRVHLMGPPLDVSLDARGKGGKARFVRSGCRPNAVLRPVLCDGKQGSGPVSSSVQHDPRNSTLGEDSGISTHSECMPPPEDVSGLSDSLSFAIFALRDLKADEEIILGWEWDDANVVHLLPALLQDKGLFPPTELAAYKLQMANILRSLGSTFTSCACGERAEGCVMRRMKEFVNEVGDWEKEHERRRNQEFRANDSEPEQQRDADLYDENRSGLLAGVQGAEVTLNVDMANIRPMSDSLNLAPSSSSSSNPQFSPNLHIRISDAPHSHMSNSSIRPRSPSSMLQDQSEEQAELSTWKYSHSSRLGKPLNHLEVTKATSRSSSAIDLGPLIGVQRGFRTREKVPGSGGLSGVEMDEDDIEDDLPAKDGHSQVDVRLGPRVDKTTNATASSINHDEYNQGIFSPPSHIFPPNGVPSHPYTNPIHSNPPFPPFISPYGSQYGASYHFSYPPYPPYVLRLEDTRNSKLNNEKETLFWGEYPPSAPGADKGKRWALDREDIAVDVQEDEMVDAGKEDDYPRRSERYVRMQSVHPRSRSPPSLYYLDQVVEESEIPPKMKRRLMQTRKECISPVDGNDTQRTSEGMQVDDEAWPRNQQEHTSHNLSTTAAPNRRLAASPVIPAISAAQAPVGPSPSTTSPLLSFANLSLLSPAVSLPPNSTSSLYPYDRQLFSNDSMTMSLWDAPSIVSRGPRRQSMSPRPRSRSRYQSPHRLMSPTRRVVTDPLAALAAAAAAARPITPLPNRTYPESQSTSRSRSPHPMYSDRRLSFPPAPVLGAADHTTYSCNTPFTSVATPTGSQNHRPISSPNYGPGDRIPLRVSDDHDLGLDNRDNGQFRDSINHDHDAVLGPGGIRVLSSPEHAWLPLRRGSTSSSSLVSVYDSANDYSILHSGLDRPESAVANGLSDDYGSLKVKEELLEEPVAPSPIHYSRELSVSVVNMDAEISGPRLSTLVAGVGHDMQDDSVPYASPYSPVHRSPSLRPSSVNGHHMRRHYLISPINPYIVPLSPSTPPTNNLDEIPPWPASPSPKDSPSAFSAGLDSPLSSSSQVPAAILPNDLELSRKDESRPLASVAAAPTGSEVHPLMQSHSMPSPMSALSSVRSSPHSDRCASLPTAQGTESKATTEVNRIESSPLSSPLSSPIQNLISLPPHSAPAEPSSIPSDPRDVHMAEDIPNASDPNFSSSTCPVATLESCPDSSYVPALEYSTSMTPLHSPGNISRTTPEGVESSAVEALEVDSVALRDKTSKDELFTTSVNADSSLVVSVKTNGEQISEEPYSTTSILAPQMAPPASTRSASSKVKMSLKDFANRKRRQKQEEQRGNQDRKKVEGEGEAVDEMETKMQETSSSTNGSHPAVEVMTSLDLVTGDNAYPTSGLDPTTSSASLTKSLVPLGQLDQSRRTPPKSDVDVIMKASETLSKLMNLSSLSSASLSGSSDHATLPSSVASSAVANTALIYPSIARSAVTDSSLCSSNRLGPVQPSPLEVSLTNPIGDNQHIHRYPESSVHRMSEDGEIEDGDEHYVIKTSLPVHPFSSTNSKPTHSPPPRPFKFYDTGVSSEQRSRTPPTQPRSFAVRASSITSIPNGSPPTRSLGLASASSTNASSPKLPATALSKISPSPLPSAALINPALGRTPPSGPRALRQSQHQHSGGGGGYLGPRYSGAYVPRGVPYDTRERDRFRDRGGGDLLKDKNRDRDLSWNGAGPLLVNTRDSGGWAR